MLLIPRHLPAMEEIVGYFYDPPPTYFGDRKKQSLFKRSSHKKFNSDLPDIPVTALCLGAFFLQVICVFQFEHPERTEENKIAYENFLETLEKVHQSAPLLDYESNEKAQWYLRFEYNCFLENSNRILYNYRILFAYQTNISGRGRLLNESLPRQRIAGTNA